MPVFVINGFLEAGKTQFITNTLQQDYFQADGTTVLILCEEGDTEYDKEILKKTRTKIVTVEDISEMDEDFYGRIEALYDPARVLIEWNGMWPQDQLQLPDTWELFQQITIIDGSTFELYLSNMKPLLALLVKRSELVIMNRCDEVSDENITRYRRGFFQWRCTTITSASTWKCASRRESARNGCMDKGFKSAGRADLRGRGRRDRAGGSGRGSSVRHEGRCDQDQSEGLRHLVHRRHG